MALGAALATGKPQAYSVVPGPGLLNSAAALLTAYRHERAGAGADRPNPGRRHRARLGHLHEIRDQAGIIARLVDFSARIREPGAGAALVAEALRAMVSGRPGPAALECAIDVWGKRGRCTPIAAAAGARAADRRRRDARGRQAARRGEASADRLRRRRAGCLGRSHGALRACCRRRCSAIGAAAACSTAAIRSASRCRSAASCGARPTRCSASARGCSSSSRNGASTSDLEIMRVDADPEEPARVRKPAVGADRRRRADPAPADRRAARAQYQARLAPGRDGRSGRRNGASGCQARRRSSPSSRRSAPNCRRTASSSTR